MEFKKRICAAFGLPEDTTDEELATKCEAMCKATASAGEDAGKLTASLTAATESTTKLQARVAELEGNEAKHAAALFERDFETAFKASLDEGRTGLPDMRDTLHSVAVTVGLPAAVKLMAALPRLVMAEQGIAGKPAADKVEGAASELDAFIAEQMKAGKTYVEAMRAANVTKRAAVEATFTNVIALPTKEG